MTERSLLERLGKLQLIVVTGKGGVGKSVVAASLGRLLAAEGRQTLLVEIDPRENLHQLLDVPPSGGDTVRVSPRLHLQHLDPRTVIDDLVREKLRIGPLVRRVLESPIHGHFVDGAPGLRETAALGRVLRLLQGHGPRRVPTPEVVVFDAPATGHGVSLLTAPLLVAEVIDGGPVGNMAHEIASLVTDRNRCGVAVVTSAEEMPVQEAIDLLDLLRDRLARKPDLMVVNALYPPLPAGCHEAAAPADPALELWALRRSINERELRRLEGCWHGPIVLLPLLPIDPGPPLVEALRSRLRRALETPP